MTVQITPLGPPHRHGGYRTWRLTDARGQWIGDVYLATPQAVAALADALGIDLDNEAYAGAGI